MQMKKYWRKYGITRAQKHRGPVCSVIKQAEFNPALPPGVKFVSITLIPETAQIIAVTQRGLL